MLKGESSCLQCRRRKIRCDRGKPCQHCVKANCVDQCLYDAPLEAKASIVPKQIVFPSKVPNPGPIQREPQPGVTSTSSAPAFATPSTSPASSHQGPHIGITATASVTSAQWLWHGSKAVDRYVEPFNSQSIAVPKEVVRGEDDTILHWGRSHISNFMPFVSILPRKGPIELSPLLTAPDHGKHELAPQVRS